MTEVLRVRSPGDAGRKDPNDYRADASYRVAIEQQAESAPRQRRSLRTTVAGERHPSNIIDLRAVRASDFQNKPVPVREWAWQHWASFGTVTGLSGPPGVAKSLLAQQICTHTTAGMPLFGDTMTKVPALHVTCEDSADELHRRQVNICRAMRIDFPSNLHLMSWVGDESLLVHHDNGLFVRTQRFNDLLAYIQTHGIRLVTLDLIPDFWNGNEIVRTQVNGFVKGHLGYLAREANAAVIPLFHPSKSGMADGSGTSGSTAWEGSFRGRIYLARPADDEDLKTPDRIITRPKANYAELDEKEITWRDGYLYEKADLPKSTEQDREEYWVTAFLTCLDHCNRKDVPAMAAKNSPDYYAKKFPALWKRLDARRRPVTKKQFEIAFDRAEFEGLVERDSDRRGRRGVSLKFLGYNHQKTP